MKHVLIVSLILVFVSTALAAQQNLIDLHKNASKLNNKECLACHAKVLKENSLNKNHKMFHKVHLESKLETPKLCADCHQSVDLREGSAAALRKQVDPQICLACHSGGFKGAKVLFVQ
jgi:hypothetical protein